VEEEDEEEGRYETREGKSDIIVITTAGTT